MGCSNYWEVTSMYSVVLLAALTTSVDLPDRGGCRGGGRRGGGCCGCYGGGMGYGYGGCMGMGMGMGYGGCMGMGMGYGGCMGMGYGGGCMGMGGYGMGLMGGGMILQGATQQSGEKIKTAPKGKDESMLPAPATIVVELPADAKLLIDNAATNSTGGSRAFQSPTLSPGKDYHYTLKAEVVRDGKPVQVERVVDVKAGQITQVTLTLPSTGVAQR
jgi:uncharacterized protein (TIGR03000 family)